ncbi:MAG: serine/threonine protein kinase [Deltaproteobacteria bacterium]|nr:serine/threonine protein kinase [Deltaproteobacteria bacterium]
MGKVVAHKFRIEKLLGVGGMGKVYKARQLSLDKAVVVKVLHDQFREDPQLVQRFQREAKAASRLNHPNSIQIIDFGQDEGGVVFMAMEFLQGQDLFTVLKKQGALPAERIARIMVQVCSALTEAHEQNVIHRDLKPENIMVEDRRGQRDFVKVLDFGIAKIQDAADGGQALTQAGMVCGTPEYMSPEQARGLQLDARSDIYALGVVMYQLAVGELPFTADTPIGIVTKHILEKPVPPRQRRPDVDAQLEAIILKAMEKEAGKRYGTVAEMAEELEALGRTLSAARGSSFNEPSQSQPRPSSPGPAGGGTPATGGASPPSGAGATRTAPTPTGHVGAVVELPHPAPATSAGGARGLKVAAASFVGVLAVAVGALYLLGVLPPKDEVEADAGSVGPAAHDAGALRVLDAGVIAPPPVLDAGVKVPPIDRAAADAGTAAHVVDAGSKKPPPPPPPPPPLGGRAAATALHKAAVKVFNSTMEPDGRAQCPQDLGDKFVAAAKKDPTFADPFWYIAQCAHRSGNDGAACGAVAEFERRGGSAGRVTSLRNITGCK